MDTHTTARKLVDAKVLLETLFDENSRPSMRWLREQQRSRVIPSVRLGRLIFFNPEQVNDALEKRTLKPKGKK